MLLEAKNAVIYGGGGKVGGAVATAELDHDPASDSRPGRITDRAGRVGGISYAGVSVL